MMLIVTGYNPTPTQPPPKKKGIMRPSFHLGLHRCQGTHLGWSGLQRINQESIMITTVLPAKSDSDVMFYLQSY